jgi:hypothetical protein
VKTVIAVAVAVLVIAPASFAVGSARDPRVPALQRRVGALEFKVSQMCRAATYASTFGGREPEFESYISSLRASCG